MIFKKPKKLFASLVLVLAFLTLYAVLSSNVSSAKKQIFIYPRSGPFVVSINVTGQLEAKNSTSILAPEELSKAEIWEIKIDQIVDEGTIVKKGDFVALLDRSNVLAKISEQEREIDKILNQKIQYEIDTAIQLDKFRDGISDLKFEIEQKEVLLNQSLYEPPATIEQLKMNLQKAEQDHTRALKAYDLQLKKLTAEFQKIRLALTSAHERLSSLRKLLDELTITAPEGGMVIYKKERGGNKLGQGAVIKIWDPTVATLPDFTTMISKTFVSEIDISKIEINQDVTVTLDAFPERKYQGRIVSIANIGEERPHSHENVFEVRIELEKADRLLRPSMTTKNEIITAFQKTSLYVPLEAVYTQEDTLAFVYMEQGFEIVKRRIKTGLTNNNYCIVAEGLAPTDKILLSDPVRKDYVFENVQP